MVRQTQALYDQLLPIVEGNHPAEIMDTIRWIMHEGKGLLTTDHEQWWYACCIVGKAGCDLDILSKVMPGKK